MDFYLPLSELVLKKAKKIKLLIMDVDGTLSDGKIYGVSGHETKSFFVRDGLGIVLLRQVKIQSAIITGRKDACVENRARDLKIDHYYAGIINKFAAFKELLALTGLQAEECAFIGDDINDLGLMTRVGLSCAVADCHEGIKNYADYITVKAGGFGAVREVADILLFAQNHYQKAVTQFTREYEVTD